MRLKSFGSGVNCQLKDFKLQGSNNDADWTDILTAVGSNTDAWQEWAFANSVAYRYYRIYVTSSYYTGGNQVSIWEIELMESTSPPADYGSDVYLNNHCQDDFDDIRFTKSNGDTLLDYWLESKVNGTSAIFWIEFDSIPASPSTVNFYIYYDNPSASSASNEKSTFGIENRNFDIPPAGNSWTCVKSGVGACTAVDTDYHSSPYNAYSYETSRACMRARLGQNITVPDMASVYLHYWIKWWVNTWGNHVGIVIGATTTDASSGTWLEAHSGNGSGSSSGWVERWVDISAWKGQTVKLEVVDQDDTDDDPTYCSYGDHGGWVRADDFYISSAGSAVSPEPTWGTWGGEEKGQASPFACKKADNICSCGSPSCPTDGFCEECCGGCCCSGSCHTCPCPVVGVCNPHNVWGWAWSENIGWISFSCEDTMPVGVEGPDYGVDIDRATGLFSGYAWSENIGWIRFNPPPDPTYSNNYPAAPYHSARVSTTTDEVSGWARACAGTANPDICATGTNPAAGSWDGWIKLRGPNYGVWIDTSVSPAEFRNWAWSDMVVGWLRFAGPVINANGLAASWAMDEGNEGYIYDSSGNNSTGTISGATWTTSGKYGSALSFDGNDYVNLGSPASLAVANTTIEAWIKPSSVSGYYLIYGLKNLPKLYINSSGKLELYNAAAANTVLTPNVWTYVVVTSDGTNVRYYVNGVPDGTVAHAAWSTTPSQVKIGQDPAGTTQNFLGLIDEVRIYSRALTQEEITDAYNGYKVMTSFSINQPPQAAISCDGSGCPGSQCNANWVTYQAIANPPCIYTIKNDSTDPDGQADIIKSEWYLKKQGDPDTAYALKLNCGGVCNYTLQSDVEAGDYVVKLYVEDTKVASASTTHSLTVKGEASAGFVCSLDNINWQVCENLSNKVSQGELVYFKDDLSLDEHSVASEGAAITSRIWARNGINFDSANNSTSSVNLADTTNTIRLTITDSAVRSDYQEHIISTTLPLPEWKEISPF